MKVHYISCAKSSSVDGKTNQLSLFHVLDEITATAYPLKIESFCVAALFEREAGEEGLQSYNLAVKLDGGLLASFTMSIDMSGARRNRSVNTIQGLTIPAAGMVTVVIVQKGVLLAEWFMVAVASGAPRPAVAPHVSPTAPAPVLKSAAALN